VHEARRVGSIGYEVGWSEAKQSEVK
jgi:hypothetical protein